MSCKCYSAGRRYSEEFFFIANRFYMFSFFKGGLIMTGLLHVLLFLVVFLLLWFFLQKTLYKNQKPQYDERQTSIRGDAYKAGFYTLILAFSANAVLETALQFTWGTRIGETMVLLCIGLLVFAGVCIFKDSYITDTQSPWLSIALPGLIGILNLGSGIKSLYHNWVYGIQEKFNNITLVTGILLTGIACMIFFRWMTVGRRDGEEE